MGIGGWFGGLAGAVAGILLVASFMAPDQARTSRTVLAWNAARVGSLVVLAGWFVLWLLPSLIPG